MSDEQIEKVAKVLEDKVARLGDRAEERLIGMGWHPSEFGPHDEGRAEGSDLRCAIEQTIRIVLDSLDSPSAPSPSEPDARFHPHNVCDDIDFYIGPDRAMASYTDYCALYQAYVAALNPDKENK